MTSFPATNSSQLSELHIFKPIAVILVIVGVMAWITYIVLKKAVKYVVDELSDEISAFVILIALAIIVYFASVG